MCSHCETDQSEYTERDAALDAGDWPTLTEWQAKALRARLTSEQIIHRGERRWLKEAAAICLFAALGILFAWLLVGG